jgi:hypothetical protein
MRPAHPQVRHVACGKAAHAITHGHASLPATWHTLVSVPFLHMGGDARATIDSLRGKVWEC